jgi:hypothetical protein
MNRRSFWRLIDHSRAAAGGDPRRQVGTLVIRPEAHHAHIHWVLPISPWEHTYRSAHGLDALEELFAARRIEFANPFRLSPIG